ncbi:MAG: penicillin-binding transpeptidase domain-containing protein [Candidatus Promineifilaceae bacterium]
MNPIDPLAAEQGRLASLSRVSLLGFAGVALALFVWGVLFAPELRARADNPRRVQEELAIRRGSILDADGGVLAETVIDPEGLRRIYPVTEIGPAVGYYSFRHGTAGVEEGLNGTLRGDSADFWRNHWRFDVLHLPRQGRDVRITLVARWQRAAEALFGPAHGALVLISIPDRAILAMVSHAAYDPNLIDERFESLTSAEGAPLLNRATQGNYQPGAALQPYLVAAGLDEGLLSLADRWEGTDPALRIDGAALECAARPEPAEVWLGLLQSGCPAPVADLGRRMGPGRVSEALSAFGFYEAPQLPLAVASADNEGIDDAGLAAAGQGNLTISPLQLGLALAALADGGQFAPSRLVLAVENETGVWQPTAVAPPQRQAVASAAARQTLAGLNQAGATLEHSAWALAGADVSRLAWYQGVAPAAGPRYAVIVVIEGAQQAEEAGRIGRSLLLNLLQAPG